MTLMMKRLPFALFRYCQSYDLRIEPKDIADVHGKAHIPATCVNFVQKKMQNDNFLQLPSRTQNKILTRLHSHLSGIENFFSI